MTDKEAIEALRKDNELCYKQCEGACCDVENDKCTCGDVRIVSAFEELEQYRSIGTVEECREAREKQRAKKPLSRTHCKDGNHPLSQDIGRCPSCKSIISENMLWCDDCGQKLDWSD